MIQIRNKIKNHDQVNNYERLHMTRKLQMEGREISNETGINKQKEQSQIW